MARRYIRIGSVENAVGYDDADYDSAIETDQPIKAGAPVDPDDVVTLNDLPTVSDITSATGNIADNAIVRGDGGARGVQDSLVSIDDSGNVDIPTGQGLQVNSVQVVTDQQAAEGDAAAISAISLGAGADTVDRATFNTDLGTLVTEINALRTTLNSLLAKLRTHGLIDT